MGLTRRQFLRTGSMSLLASACAPAGASLGPDRVWTTPRATSAGDPLLVTVFLRGGADPLHLAPPARDRDYERLRGGLALSETLPFSKDFSLHPELAPLAPWIERGELALVPAAGSPHETRSHFEAQDYMELGEPGPTRLTDGWLARAMGESGTADPFGSLAIAGELPLALRGSGAFAIGDPEGFGLPGASGTARDALAALYAHAGDAGDEVGRAGGAALDALHDFERAVGSPRRRGRFVRRPKPPQLARSAEQLVRLDRAGIGLRAVWLETSGWDTHAGQGTESGAMARQVRDLAEGLAALAEGFGERRELVVVVMTEFGRTVRPNGSGGTDHGHGGAMLVLSPRVRGGVHGEWAGLGEKTLWEGRDLPVLTDWRHVLHEALHAHLGTAPPPETFPGFDARPLGLFA